MNRTAVRLSVWAIVAGCVAGPAWGADKPDPAAVKFFEQRVRPVLANRCFQCHGPEKQKNSLRLDSVAAMLKGGESGPAIKPGKPDESLLLLVLRDGKPYQMPPRIRLPNQEIADVARWIAIGAPWPDGDVVVRPDTSKTGPVFTQKDRDFWAFQAVLEPKLPAVSDGGWVQSPIDAFILAKLEAKGLKPAPHADRRTLVRRVTYDLTGLPLTPAEVEHALSDESQDWYERLVDRLLASPAYGERWGRHWLDLARFADSNGMDENLVQANAWRYRDYVIRSFNAGKPYDRFVQEQLAGDLLPGAATDHAMIVATGFLSLGPKMLAEDDPAKMEMDIVDEQIDTTGKVFLGLTLGCARCHDHKFDPLPTADYYSLAGIFKSTKTMNNFRVVAQWHERPVATKEQLAQRQEHDAKVAKLKSAAGATIGLVQRAFQAQVQTLEKNAPDVGQAMAVTEGKPGNLRVHLRGSHLTLGAEVPRQFPRILAGEKQSPLDDKQSGRLQLAQWITRSDNPLTARVMVNRVWQWHFGKGLVRSPDNFGRLGEQPTHPELLDWLARRFVEDGWSLKSLHRRILLSATYQMSTTPDEKAALADPENRLLWRRERRRLEVESLRDALLAVSGRLERTMGGTLLEAKNRAYVPGYPNTRYDRYDFDRRSVYLPVIRSDLYTVFQAFDFADPSTSAGERAVTTVAPQALFLMNGKVVLEQAKHLAGVLLASTAGDDAGRVRSLFLRAYSRPATEAEVDRCLAFLVQVEKGLEADVKDVGERRRRAWTGLCRAIVSVNEFSYVE